MASPDVLDFDVLLAPISDESPAGVATRQDPAARQIFHQVRIAREAARDAEKAIFEHSYLPPGGADRPPEPPRPNWSTVYEPAIELLSKHSKDLWVATWLTEALARLHGFAGLRDGFRLLRELCQRYWGSLHPLPDPDEDETIEVTVSQIGGFNNQIGKSPDPIDLIPITPETRAWPDRLTSFDYREAEHAGGSPRTAPDGTPRPSLDVFESAVREGDRSFFGNLREDAKAALDEFQQLVAVLDERCGKDASGFGLAPPTSSLLKSLREINERILRLTSTLFPDAADDAAANGGDAPAANQDADITAGTAAGAGAGQIRNREDAFRELSRVADYFRRTEPHSPISFALDQVIRWGRMSLPELLTELIPNADVRHDMFRRAGIPAVEE